MRAIGAPRRSGAGQGGPASDGVEGSGGAKPPGWSWIIRGMVELERFNGRRAAVLENAALRVTVLEGGGHIASVLDKTSGVNPLWIPPWPSIEPAAYGPDAYETYGSGIESRLLAGIMGHNVCLDIFGGPSAEEAAAGQAAHGEAPVAAYAFEGSGMDLTMRAELPMAQLRFERQLELADRAVRVREVVENLSPCDRPIAWTQHVTLGPPFLERGVTEFRASATRSLVFEQPFGVGDYLEPGAEFEWPLAPRAEGGTVNMQRYVDAAASSAYTSHLMDPAQPDAFFVAYSPRARLAFGYVWHTAEFPWMGIWEENHSRSQPPWNGKTLTRGMEFGVSPVPESRRAMIERGRLFGVPTYRWIPARTKVAAEYWILCRPATAVPERLERSR
jgi:hypothetical protein